MGAGAYADACAGAGTCADLSALARAHGTARRPSGSRPSSVPGCSNQAGPGVAGVGAWPSTAMLRVVFRPPSLPPLRPNRPPRTGGPRRRLWGVAAWFPDVGQGLLEEDRGGEGGERAAGPPRGPARALAHPQHATPSLHEESPRRAACSRPLWDPIGLPVRRQSTPPPLPGPARKLLRAEYTALSVAAACGCPRLRQARERIGYTRRPSGGLVWRGLWGGLATCGAPLED